MPRRRLHRLPDQADRQGPAAGHDPRLPRDDVRRDSPPGHGRRRRAPRRPSRRRTRPWRSAGRAGVFPAAAAAAPRAPTTTGRPRPHAARSPAAPSNCKAIRFRPGHERSPRRVRRRPARENGQIQQLLEEQNLAELRRAVHQLKVAGGGFGFPQYHPPGPRPRKRSSPASPSVPSASASTHWSPSSAASKATTSAPRSAIRPGGRSAVSNRRVLPLATEYHSTLAHSSARHPERASLGGISGRGDARSVSLVGKGLPLPCGRGKRAGQALPPQLAHRAIRCSQTDHVPPKSLTSLCVFHLLQCCPDAARSCRAVVPQQRGR